MRIIIFFLFFLTNMNTELFIRFNVILFRKINFTSIFHNFLNFTTR